MKKVITVLSLVGLAGAASIAFANNGSAITPVSAESNNNFVLASSINSSLPETATTYIKMEPASFSNWNDNWGVIEGNERGYWDPKWTFSNMDDFFCGEAKEGSTDVALNVNTWTQYTQYVYFQWGSAANNRTDGRKVTLIFHYRNVGETDWITEEVYNDTHVGNPMMFRYFKINDANWANLDKENGFEMFVQLFDNAPGGYGFHNFGYLHVNQTFEQVGLAARDSYDFIVNDTRAYENKTAMLLNYPLNGGLVSATYSVELEDVSEDFEDRNDFYKNWYYDNSYTRNAGEFHFDAVIGTGNYRPGDQYMPFNKEGNGFFRGWYEEGAELDGQHAYQGFVAGDAPIYRFVSAPYTLNTDSHYVSIKLAGTSSLQVLNATDNALLAEIKCQTFDTDGSQYQHEANTMNTVVMRRHIINLSAFAGQTVRFAISDYSSGGWAAAYVDDFNCDYDPMDGIRADLIEQVKAYSGENGYTYYYTVEYDVYVPSTNNNVTTEVPNNDVYSGINYIDDATYSVEATTDTSAMVSAHAFVMNYANNIKGGNGNDICDALVNDANKALINEFNNLSTDAQKIVSASDDYTVEVGDGVKWYDVCPVMEYGLLGVNLGYIAEVNGVAIDMNSASLNILLLTSQNTTFYVAIPSIVIALAIIMIVLFTIKKRRKTNN